MMYNIRRTIGLISIIAFAALTGSCAETTRPVATGKGSIRGIASIVDAPEVIFRIEERSIGNIAYKNAAGFDQFDDLFFNFNFDIFLPDDVDATRLATQFIDFVADMEYTLILTGSVADPSIIFWEDAKREWDGTETVFEPFFAHFSPAIGDVDVYFAAPGTVPVAGNAIGTLSNGERLPSSDFLEGNYDVILTAAGDPATILYTSSTILGVARTRPLFAIFDPDPSITGPVGLNLISENGSSIAVPDPAFPAQMRLYHAAFGTDNVDLYYDDDFGNRIFSDVGFHGLSPYADIGSAVAKVTLTAVNNTGAIILENDVVVTPGSRRTIALVGDPASPLLNTLIDDARPLSTFPMVRISNLASNEDFINVYLLEPGTEITAETVPRFVALPSQLDTGYFGASEGMFELTITDFGDIVPIAPSVMLDLSIGNVVDIAILDTVDPEMFEVDVFDSN